MSEDSEAISRGDSEVGAYNMVRQVLKNNAVIIDGEQPTDDEGEELGVTYQSDEAIRTMVNQAFGMGELVAQAVGAAYRDHAKDTLEDNTEE